NHLSKNLSGRTEKHRTDHRNHGRKRTAGCTQKCRFNKTQTSQKTEEMKFDLTRLLRPHIANLQPYTSARDEYTGKEGIFLDANENPFGSITDSDHNRYPDPYQLDLKEKIAEIKQVKTSQIFLGNGSDEAIDLLFRAF